MRFGWLSFVIAAVATSGAATPDKEVIIDFNDVVPVLANDKANRVEKWEEKGVVFQLARQPRTTKAKGMLGFFTHLDSGRKGIVCAMATEPIPVRATFPAPVSAVTIQLWGSTVTPVLVEAFDAAGNVVDRVSRASLPQRSAPNEPQPMITLTVSGKSIAYIEFSGPREGEYLALGELRVRVATAATANP